MVALSNIHTDLNETCHDCERNECRRRRIKDFYVFPLFFLFFLGVCSSCCETVGARA